MNTAIEADDTHPELRDRARAVDDALAPARSAASSRTASRPARSRRHRPVRARRRCSPARSKAALMLSRLYDDPAYMDRVVDHLVAHVETLRADPKEATHDRSRHLPHRRRRAHAARSRWTDPGAVALPRPRPRRLRAARRDPARRAGAAARRRAARHAARRGRARAAPCSACSPTRCTRTRWARCTAASSRRSSTPRWVARCSSMLPADAGFTTLELKTNYVRADHAGDRPRLRRRARSCTPAAASRPPKRASTTRSGTLYAHATSTCLILRGTR